MKLSDKQLSSIENCQKIIICQAENPDGDSLASALALAEIMTSLNKQTVLYCPVQVPNYLRYIKGWESVSDNFDNSADLAIIVDTSAKALIDKMLANPLAKTFFDSTPSLVLDHHAGVQPDLPFETEYVISDSAVSTGELIYDLAITYNWPINVEAATNLYISIQSDSLGLTTANTTADSFMACGNLVKTGVSPASVEEERRELAKKSARVLQYKGRLIERIEYWHNGRTAFIHIPFSEIQEYSNEYNPTMLVLDEMRMVNDVDVAIGIKTYPDGKLTAKIRSNIPIANAIAKAFGGDGHSYAAGFKVMESLDDFTPELVKQLSNIYDQYDEKEQSSEENHEAI